MLLIWRASCDSCGLADEFGMGRGYGAHDIVSEPVVCPSCRRFSTLERLLDGRTLDEADGEPPAAEPRDPSLPPLCPRCGEEAELFFEDIDPDSIGEPIRCPCCEQGSMTLVGVELRDD